MKFGVKIILHEVISVGNYHYFLHYPREIVKLRIIMIF